MVPRDGLTFSLEEYERRLQELRERMVERRIDVAIITDPENLCYLTGYQTSGYSYFQALVVPLEGEPFMVMRLLEESNVYARTWVGITRPYSDTGDAIDTMLHALKEFNLHDKWVGYERNSYFFPSYQQDRMLATFYDSNFVDCFGIVEEGRITKSDPELEVMRRAAAATEAGMRAGIEASAVGVSENDIAADVHAAMFREGGEYPAVPPYITTGPRCLIGHATWEGRRTEADECVFLELGGCFRRYHTAMMRTVFLGEPPAELIEAEVVVQEALAAMKASIRPGVTAAHVDHVARQVLSQYHGEGALLTRSGYSIGIAFAPSWDEGYMLSIKPGDTTPLREAMTFHIIPWLYGVGGDKVMALSDTVRVTEDGCASFFTLEPRLYVRR